MKARPGITGLFSLLLGLAFVSSGAALESYEARPALISVGGIILFFNSAGPLSYETWQRNDLPKDAVDAGEVTCQSCQHGVSIPLFGANGSRSTSLSGAQGDGSFKKALANLQRDRPEIRGMYDVKIDLHQISILGIYRRLCTEVTGRGFK